MITENHNYLDMDLLRFTTAGSVDDGKSTLIGRLLYDSKSIFEDQYEAVRESSEKRGEEYVNLALLTDGLRAEREQGITIDVAYRYFATPKRKFIIADTPGHIQYTRNMVTGASTANATIILVDSRKGIIEQTMRHAYIASLLRIPHLIVCVNKMDLVSFSEAVFDDIRKKFEALAVSLNIRDVNFIPISALLGDNIVERSTHMDWYNGPTLLYLLENLHITNDENLADARFPVQLVIRPMRNEYHDYRGYAGRISGGIFSVGDAITVLPSGLTSRIKAIEKGGAEVETAYAGESITLLTENDLDISRGDMIVKSATPSRLSQELDVMVCWLSETPLKLNGKYSIRHTTREVRGIVKEISHRININTLEKENEVEGLGLNDIGKISIRTTSPLAADSYLRNRNTGSLILIDESTHVTVGAGMIL
jgi:sulfate adenylyltransferase subunit 1